MDGRAYELLAMVCNPWFYVPGSFQSAALCRVQDRSILMISVARGTQVHTPMKLPKSALRAEPFRSSEEAWYWTMAALVARQEGARFSHRSGKVPRPCEPDDVIKCLDTLYRRRRIDLSHARVLRIWGERQSRPNPTCIAERTDFRLWREALSALEWPLRVKGIVA